MARQSMARQSRNCKKTRRWLKAWLDGEVTAKLAAEIQSHLASCPSCRQWEADFRQLADFLRRAELGTAPEARPAAVRRLGVQARAEAQRTVLLLQRAAATAAAVLLVACIAGAWPLFGGGPAFVPGEISRTEETSAAQEADQDEALTVFLAGWIPADVDPVWRGR